MTDPTTLLVPALILPALIIILLSGILSGMTGFGFALIAVPLLTVVLAPQVVVPMARLHSLVSSGLVLFEARRWLDLRGNWLLILASLVGVPIGGYLLAMWDVHTLKVLIGVVTVLSALGMLFGGNVRLRRGPGISGPVGLLSGILGGSTGMAGPPLVIMFTGHAVEKHSFRANLAAVFLAQSIVSIPTYAAGGLLTPSVLTYALVLLPALLIGAPLGIRISRLFNEDVFRRVVLVAVICTGLLGIASGLRWI